MILMKIGFSVSLSSLFLRMSARKLFFLKAEKKNDTHTMIEKLIDALDASSCCHM